MPFTALKKMQDYLTHLAGFCRTNAILHGSASRREFRHPEVNSESNIHHELKSSVIPAPPWLPLACSLLGQWFCTSNPLASILWLALILAPLHCEMSRVVLTELGYLSCN